MNLKEDIRVQLHKAAFGPLTDRSAVLLCAAIDEIERLYKLRDACIEWRQSLEGDGWSEQDIRDMGRPCMGKIMVALDAVNIHHRENKE